MPYLLLFVGFVTYPNRALDFVFWNVASTNSLVSLIKPSLGRQLLTDCLVRDPVPFFISKTTLADFVQTTYSSLYQVDPPKILLITIDSNLLDKLTQLKSIITFPDR